MRNQFAVSPSWHFNVITICATSWVTLCGRSYEARTNTTPLQLQLFSCSLQRKMVRQPPTLTEKSLGNTAHGWLTGLQYLLFFDSSSWWQNPIDIPSQNRRNKGRALAATRYFKIMPFFIANRSLSILSYNTKRTKAGLHFQYFQNIRQTHSIIKK